MEIGVPNSSAIPVGSGGGVITINPDGTTAVGMAPNNSNTALPVTFTTIFKKPRPANPLPAIIFWKAVHSMVAKVYII